MKFMLGKPRKGLFYFYILPLLISLLYACGPREKVENNRKIVQSPGITDQEILIGSSLALTGHAGYLGTNYMQGAMSFLNEVNASGGINGRLIRVISYDDKYDPAKCVYNTQKLIAEDKVFALFNYVGTPTSVKVIPIVEQYNIPLVGLFSGATELRFPVRKFIFNIRGSYYQEIYKAILHFYQDLALEKFAVFYQNDAYGLDGLKNAEIAAKEFQAEIVATAHYQRGSLDVGNAVDIITKSEAQAVIMIGTYSPCAKFIRLCKQQGYQSFFYNVSFVGADEFARELGEYGNGVLVSQVVPPPDNKHLRVSGRYVELLDKYYPGGSPNFVGLEGFINAKVLSEGLRRTGENVTREGLVRALESLKDFSVGTGDDITYGPNDRQGLEYIYFTILEDGQWKFFTDWTVLKN